MRLDGSIFAKAEVQIASGENVCVRGRSESVANSPEGWLAKKEWEWECEAGIRILGSASHINENE